MSTTISWVASATTSALPLFLLQSPLPSDSDGLTLAELLESLPTDPASLVALVLLMGFVGAVVWYGTRPGKARS